MPLTAKGEKIKRAMTQEYGAKKGESVFYASRNAGKIAGVDPQSSDGHTTSGMDRAMQKHADEVHPKK